MIMTHKFFRLAIATLLLLPLGFTSCDDDEASDEGSKKPTLPTVSSTNQFYVICQGNQYAGVSGSIYSINPKDTLVTGDLFQSVNKQALGDTPQQPVRYGSKIYVPVFGSNRLWVLNAQTLKIEASVTTQSPQAVCGAAGYVFVSNNDGYVSRIDTLNFAAEPQKMQVGPNPMGMAVAKNKVLVTISDGYNFNNGYANGKKVVGIDIQSFQKTNEYTVGLNPTKVVTNDLGEAFVLCQGNYADVLPKVQKIAVNNSVSDYCEGSMITMNKNQLYVLNTQVDYTSNKANVNAKIYNTVTNEVTNFEFKDGKTPAMPTALNVTDNGNLYICSDNSPSGYSENGYVYEYKADGTLIRRYNVGIHPFGVVF